ncbi:NAD-dependent epimerase/dehydratase family protein [Ktedonosporobacter rubrisoli]|uniref:NAD-dependent epimerase/dehydratase family protein n=1 Tax=Ktedonosporobacter rubrisoli TaxID=2509675 RepID=A0A4P6JRI2_KTERU|nr:NAD-dependent epimerase/dehydratase family protein [Ktedonosporobacter rubrisoli]QBD77913.1 NAD-dependent epimerase/dehydratase family protein [Ktedonosporobacter rubrisoli]
MRILVTGATGFLGQHLARALLTRGHQVYLSGRHFAPVEVLIAAGAIPCEADLRDAPTVCAICKGMDAVYHVGALSAAWGKRSDFFATNVEGTRAVVAGCLEHGVQRLIYVSSPSVVYDGRDQFNATEQVPYPRRFTSVYSLTKKLGEDLVKGAPASLQTVVVRPKAIFGPGDRVLLPQLIAAARLRRLPQIGNGHNLVDLTYVENVVKALLLALEANAAVGKTYTITNGEHVSLWEVIGYVLGQLGLPTKLRRVPLSVALAAATLMEARAAISGSEPLLTRYSASILARTQTYDISAAQRDLGYIPGVSVAEGIELTLEKLRAEI